MNGKRPGLWSEIAGALGLLTLAVLVLSAGVLWLVLEQTEVQRRTDLALSLSGAMQSQLQVATRGDGDLAAVIDAYRDTSLDLQELYLVDRAMAPIAVVTGEPPTEPDAGLRVALFGRETHTEVQGSLLDERNVVVTAPISGAGEPRAALRVSIPLRGPEVPGGGIGFAFLFVLLCGSCVALFGWARLRRELVEPIRRVQQGTASIAAGGFGEQLEGESIREIQDLVQALNAMSTSLDDYRLQTAQQVTSLETANEDLRQAQEALIRSEKLAGVGRMAAGLAHEVGNPLSAVLGYVDLLQVGVDDPEAADEMLKRSRLELNRIHRIIQSLLGYARAGSGELVRVKLDEVITDALATVQHQPVCQALSMNASVDPDTPPVLIETDKLHQVLVNLLLNSATASPNGTVRLIAQPGPEGGAEIRCEDDGPGFDPVALERAFEPFFTTKDVGEGTGLGLATCQQVIEGAGGSIEMYNLVEQGACVRIRLPSSSP